MKLSVITVTYNALPALKKTMTSVLAQLGTDYEYLVVDGASGDGTPEFLAKNTNGRCRWISEPDGGIYEAMNKGVKMAQGEYCLFMNAGDCFVDAKVLAKMIPFLNGTDLVLGNQIHVDEQGVIDDYSYSRGSFSLDNLFQSTIAHQATFIRREILIIHPYDESLRLVSDWKFFLELFLEGSVSYKTVNVNISFFFGGGVTDKNRELGKQERLGVLSSYPEYQYIWGKPYNPSLMRMVKKKVLYFLNKFLYVNKLKKLP